MVGDEFASGNENRLQIMHLAVGFDGRENLGSLAGAGNAGHADKLVIFGGADG